LDPASGGYPLIDGMGVQQQQQQGQQVQQQQQQQQQQGIVNNDMTLMANLIDDAIGIQGQDSQSGGGSALLGGILSHMPSFNSTVPPPPPTTNATAATGISSAEGQRDESTSQDFSNTAAPPSGEDNNQPPRIEDGINQSQQVGADEQKTNPATSALDSVAAESSPQGPVLNKPQDNESPPLGDGTNFVTASTIASAESQSFSSTGNNITNNNAVQGQIDQTTGNAQWPSQQEQEQQQQQPGFQQPPAQQAIQPSVQQQVQQPIQATQQQLMMNTMLTNPAQLQVINPQAYYLWLCQQAQQPVQAPGIIQSQDIASSTAAAATTAVQQPTVAISQLMLQLQAQQQQASQQQVQQSRLIQASQALAVHQSQLQQAVQLQQQAASAHRQVPQAAIPTSSTTAGNSINNYKPISSIPPGQKKKKSKFSGVLWAR